ncbi:MAG TPA: helix-turn-helix domain-containing protein [Streptosporangiaceae bacterium]|nr:helix-turn-helix domain-containing protein [Streptosporangiaceae bacterium]
MTSRGQDAPGPRGRGRYHHGDLRVALIETAVALIAERGPAAFSMAEASRRLGVAPSAPYRHFADRDALLAAVAVRAAGLLAERLSRQAASGSPEQRLAAAAETYVRFADEQRALFLALAGAGLDKGRYPEITHAAQPISTAFLFPAAELTDGDQAAAARLVSAIVATAHGHAMLMLDGTFGSGHQAADAAARQAATATVALITGRRALV